MIPRNERAKQFMPFDAMKGLKEALEDRLERHTRVEKQDILEDKAEEISELLLKLERGMVVRVTYYKSFHYKEEEGKIMKIDRIYKYFILNEEKIFFNDIYEIKITD